MTLSKKAQIVTGVLLLAQTVGLILLAAPLGHNTPSFSVDDPIRAMF